MLRGTHGLDSDMQFLSLSNYICAIYVFINIGNLAVGDRSPRRLDLFLCAHCLLLLFRSSLRRVSFTPFAQKPHLEVSRLTGKEERSVHGMLRDMLPSIEAHMLQSVGQRIKG